MAIWAVLVDPATGEPYKAGTGGGGGGGGGGDASAANQTTEIARLTSIRDATGSTADAAYTSTDGSAVGTVVGLLKGAYVRLFGISGQLPASLGQKTMANSLAVTLASDGAAGNPGDAAYTSTDGSASGGMVGLLKGAYIRLSTLAAVVINGALRTLPLNLLPTNGTNLSGTATTTSGGLNIPAKASRRVGDVQGQNLSTVAIGFNEFGGTAAIGSAGTYTVPAGATFIISTNQQVNFVAASGTANITITDISI